MSGLRKLLDLPEHIVPLALVPVGYAKEEKGPVERFDGAKVSKNRWQIGPPSTA